tara:strand:- start:11934 stop:12395 length:462 start_codon:yes stop_codon:yes gene_type:complete
METADITIKFEAQLVSTSMTANGGHKVTLRVNPEDVLDGKHLSSDQAKSNGRVRSLMTQSPNTRYMCVLVQLAEETDEAVVQPDAEEGKKAVAAFSLLCRSNRDWQRWVGGDNEEETVSVMKEVLGIQSRKDLITNDEALAEFNRMKETFFNE